MSEPPYDRTSYALATLDGHGTPWFLRRGAFMGNLLRTDDPHSAWTWPDVTEARGWVESLPAAARSQLVDRTLLLVPLTLAVGDPVESLSLRVLESEGDAPATIVAEVVPIVAPPIPAPTPVPPTRVAKRRPVAAATAGLFDGKGD